MLKKLTLALFFFIFSFLLVKPVFAAEPVFLQFFWASGCPHCAKEEVFLDTLKDKYPQLEISNYEISHDQTNAFLLQTIGKKLSADVSGVPFTVIGNQYVSGFESNETTGKTIEAMILSATPPPATVSVPIFGRLNPAKLSLPVLTFIIALLDGFNPCAMWVLLFLISLLLGLKDRKRMWLLGTSFIFASAFVYFLFLTAWLNLFLFLGFIPLIRLIIGLLALGAAGYYLRDYWVNRSGGCQVMADSKRQQIFVRLQAITQKKQLALALLGIVLLAFAVNLVELICSAGLPAIFTQVLSMSKLSPWQYYAYLLFYILIFMLDDLIIFVVAMVTLKAVGVESKYSRFSHLVGGILMLIIGLLLIFKPELLMFG